MNFSLFVKEIYYLPSSVLIPLLYGPGLFYLLSCCNSYSPSLALFWTQQQYGIQISPIPVTTQSSRMNDELIWCRTFPPLGLSGITM